MALTDESNGNGFYMPVAPAYNAGYGNNGSGFFGGDWAWIILLLLIGGNGWGLGGFGMGGMMMPWMMGGMGGFGLDYLYPWLNNSQHISDGFRDQQLNTQLSSIGDRVSAGFSDVQLGISGLGRDICQTGNSITGAVRDGFNAAEIAANSRQMASLQQQFGIQSAIQGSAAANAAATADLKYTVATEACADRNAIASALRDVITANTASTQRIIDQLTQDKLDSKNDIIAQLRQELLYARGQASQSEQTAQILAGQSAIPGLTYTRLSECPVSTVPVYGRQPIFSCPQSASGCGFNTGVGFAA